jgi:hypothetical protein
MRVYMINYIREMINLASGGDDQGVIFFIAVYAFVVCSYSTIRQIMMCKWKMITGKLIRQGISKFGNSSGSSSQAYKLDALYEYKVEGKKYFGTEVSAWKMVASHNLKQILKLQYRGIDKTNGGEISVYFNPGNPKKSLLVLPGLKSQLITMLIGLTPTIYYLYRYWKY